MSHRRYVLTAAAEADIRDIVRRTRKQWGTAQARLYGASLERGIAKLAAGQGVFKQMDDLHPLLRVAPCEHHVVFCLRREREPALIVAILHERMDLLTRMVNQLNETR